jgi:type IV secretory pathway VirD2 relaxase
MVKVTGRTGDPGHLRAHLDYVSRNGELDLETQDGTVVSGRGAVRDLAADWAAEQLQDRRTRAGAPFSHSVVLSMPAGTDPIKLRDAARAFAADTFAGAHDCVFTLHTDTARPHVHLSICSRGHAGQRLNPRKADLEMWRQRFAQALRDRGVEAEATPRRARGVTRKPERGPIRRMRERHAAGQGEEAQVRRSAYREAAKAAFGQVERLPWETQLTERQARVRGLYLAQAQVLRQSSDPADQALGGKVEAFVKSMPQPDSQRLALARELRAARGRDLDQAGPGGRERSR